MKCRSINDFDYEIAEISTKEMHFFEEIEEAINQPKLKEIYKKGISQPVLFIGGGKEAAVTFGNTEPMKAALPNLRKVIVLQGCGHWLQQERSKEVNEALIEFLNTNF